MIQVVIHWINTLKNTTIELHILYTLYIHAKLANWMLFTMFLKKNIYYFFLLIYTCIILIIILKVDKLFQILWTKKLLPEYY